MVLTLADHAEAGDLDAFAGVELLVDLIEAPASDDGGGCLTLPARRPAT